ncbi:hypothetical protein EBL89_03480 [Cereibacter sphaeroides]|uniref:hypothetical protein n=1 Tax=Cereibacter sphaeroides TaxID=1063 RepID=UPI000E5B2D10|nr:hypothetical protein [Cereibacter sphaeroides]AZB54426.1 hypothetical protein EBL89_03480 [Cereibacter sphaeroides]AZB58679.1 hypothetical protein EBL88_03460 [Cereibacter sphaeroides]RIA01331.1 hypothetical protein D1122_01315 [Cereibacter sphaeroides]
MNQHSIPSGLLQAIASYLSARPFVEVEPLISGIRQSCYPIAAAAETPTAPQETAETAPAEPVPAVAPTPRKPAARSKSRAK